MDGPLMDQNLDVSLDPSDPLTLLINNHNHNRDPTIMDDDDIQSPHRPPDFPPDWSHLSAALWPTASAGTATDHCSYPKYPDLELPMGFNTMDLDLEYDPSMAVEPSALHLGSPYAPPLPFFASNGTTPFSSSDLFASAASSFPFTFGSDESSNSSDSSHGHRKSRRLSLTSLSSSSGASLSPLIEPKTTTAATQFIDPSDELAQRVRRSVGVMLAVPTGMRNSLSVPSQSHQAKIPMTRLPRTKVATTKAKRVPAQPPKSDVSSSAASTPPPSDSHIGSPEASHHSEPVIQGTGPTLNALGRPKTNHTTIERRYRTNLNARIQSLRQAVPALRVLEDKGKPNREGDGGAVDVIDDRGFVDGVKVARKCSKANVLGKAVEYIRVLKKRENRLTREQNGLRSLIGGLVGGPALLKEWEREWREKFGGEEKDEVEGEEMEPLSEDDEGDDEDVDEGFNKEPQDGRARKKAKIIKAPKKERKPVAPATVQAALTMTARREVDNANGIQTVVPEKRKRGRPRKVPATSGPEEVSPQLGPRSEFVTSVVVSDEHQPTAPAGAHPAQAPVPQYLLATFALFSFFNSPVPFSSPSSSAHAHTHSGEVLGHGGHAQAVNAVGAAAYGWRDIIQVFHLLVSVLVFLSIILPWLPTAIQRTKIISFFHSSLPSLFQPPHVEKTVNAPVSSPSSASTRPNSEKTAAVNPPALVDALDGSCRGSAEGSQLRSALASAGAGGLVQAMLRRNARTRPGFEQEKKAWVRLGELAVLDRMTSFASRLQTYWWMSSYISPDTASTTDLSTLALLVQPLSRSKAAGLWSRAKKAQQPSRAYERLVLHDLGGGVDEAVERLATQSTAVGHGKCSPIVVLATMLVRERLKRHSAVLFVKTVRASQRSGKMIESEEEDVEEEGGDDDDDLEEEEKKVTIDAAKSLGGRIGELGEMLERVWKTGVGCCDSEGGVYDAGAGDDDNEDDSLEAEVTSLLTALVLYRRVAPSSVLSTSGRASGVSILLSPPPSPSRKNAGLHLALRRTLGAKVFDFTAGGVEGGSWGKRRRREERLGVALEDARDRVVDMLVDVERQGRGGRKFEGGF